MPIIKATIQLDIDGEPVPGFSPLVLRQSVAVVQTFNYAKADAAGYASMPIGAMDPFNVLAVRASKAQTNLGNTSAPFQLDQGGLLLAFGVTMDNSPIFAVNYNPGDSSVVQLTGLAGGAA